ncbi:hypothetical protein K8R42_05070, partial [bacterium]|nr:hypothetical protein [bacterium]
NIDLRSLALEIAYNILWPLQDYLQTIDRLILRLGGKVPHRQHLSMKKISTNELPDHEKGTVKEMLAKYKEFNFLRLSSNKIIGKNNRKKSPTVENWIKDYVHFSGAGFHNSLQRSQYLAKSPNILQLNNDEKASIRHFFTSYDANSQVEFDSSDIVLIVSSIENKEDQSEKQEGLNKSLRRLRNEFLAIDQKIISGNFILSEAGGEIKKVRNVLWNAIGMQDTDKVISSLKFLIEKKALDLMLKEDTRFKNILKRFVSIKYGRDMEKAFDTNMDHLLARRIFLEMIFVDKLHLDVKEAGISAFYLTNLSSDSGQVVYFDKKDSQLKWREIQTSGGNFAWVDNIN